MLFLLNTVVVKIPDAVALPRGLGALTRMSPAAVLKAGGEIYAKHPRLEYDRLDIAEWYCGLLMAKHPYAAGAQFIKDAGGYRGRLAAIPFGVLARLFTLQREGLPIEAEVQRTIWDPADSALRKLLPT